MTKREILTEIIKIENILLWDTDRMSRDGQEGMKQLHKLKMKLKHEVK